MTYNQQRKRRQSVRHTAASKRLSIVVPEWLQNKSDEELEDIRRGLRKCNDVADVEELGAVETEQARRKAQAKADKLLSGQILSFSLGDVKAKREGDGICVSKKGNWMILPFEETDGDDLYKVMSNFDEEWQGRVGQHLDDNWRTNSI